MMTLSETQRHDTMRYEFNARSKLTVSQLSVPNGTEQKTNELKNEDKKLSYCCDSRSYCMQEYDRLKQLCDIYFNAIHCDRSASTCEQC